MNHAQRVIVVIGLAIAAALTAVAVLPTALGDGPSSGYMRGVAVFGVAAVVWTGLALLLFDTREED